jgi:hypothetical protein
VGGGKKRSDDLIVEALGEETLVYDPATDEALCLDSVAAVEFRAAPDDISRRQVVRRLALAGAAAAATAPLVKTIVAPTAAHAQSGCACGNAACVAGQACAAGVICLTCLGSVGSGAVCTPGVIQCCDGCTAVLCPQDGTC